MAAKRQTNQASVPNPSTLPRTPLPERRALETRKRILDAANVVFARRGYGGASVDEILAEAGLSKGAFYHHFQSKEALFQVLLADRARQCTERMAESITPGASVAESVHAMLSAGWTFLTADPGWAGIQMEFWVHATRERWAQEAMAESLQQCQSFLSNAIADAQKTGRITSELDPEVAARLMLALNDGIMVQWRIQPDDVDPLELVSPMADMIVRYLTCTEEG